MNINMPALKLFMSWKRPQFTAEANSNEMKSFILCLNVCFHYKRACFPQGVYMQISNTNTLQITTDAFHLCKLERISFRGRIDIS